MGGISIQSCEIYAMCIDVVLVTNKDARSCHASIESICEHTLFHDMRLVVVCDRVFANSNEEEKRRQAVQSYISGVDYCLVSQYNDCIAAGEGGASGARNRSMSYIREDAYIVRIDDDVVFPHNALYNALTFLVYFETHVSRQCMIAPVLYYRQTSRVQMIGFSGFSYRLGWPLPIHTLDRRARVWTGLHVPKVQRVKQHDAYSRYTLASVGGSCVVAHASIFMKTLFDERIPYIYEDLDMTTRAVNAGVSLVVPRSFRVFHMERPKTHLEQSFIGSSYMVRAKAAHRWRFVRNSGTWRQRLIYCCIGVHIHTMWLCVKLMRYGKFHLLGSLFLGHWQGIYSIIQDPSKSVVASYSISAIDDTKTLETN